MRLYHGTSEKSWREILNSQGILPRRITHKNNWKHTTPAHPNAVYLTNCYAPYFAVVADDILKIQPAKAAIIEVETDDLISNLTIDEDVLEQSTRAGRRFSKPEMYQRTALARGKIISMRGTDAWQKSLDYMGTCAHIGTIPFSSITRVVLVDIKEHSEWAWSAMDPSITHLNYLYCGNKYKHLTHQAFEIGEIVYETR